MNNFDKLYYKIITEAAAETAGINYKKAIDTAYDSTDPVELGKLFKQVKNELGVDKGFDILMAIANNKNIATADFKMIADCGGHIEEQLYNSLADKVNRVPEEIIERQETWINNNKKNITPYSKILEKKSK